MTKRAGRPYKLTWCITILMCLCVIQAQDELVGELGEGVGDDQESREAIQAHLVYNHIDVSVLFRPRMS